MAAGDGNGKSFETAESANTAELKALEELDALVQRKAETAKKLTGASLESMLAGMEVSGWRVPSYIAH